MKRSAIIHSAFIAFLTFFLAACGGGNDGALPLAGQSDYTLTLTAAPAMATANTPVTLTATLRDPSGALANNKTLTFNTTAGRLPTASAVTTNGIATVTLLAGSGGAATGQATAIFREPSGNFVSASAVVDTAGNEPTTTPGSTEPTIALAAFDSNGDQSDSANPVTSVAPGTLRAIVLSAAGTPVPNVIVTFDAGSLASVSQTTDLTDASGVAEVTITAEAAGGGTASASATVGTTPISATTVFATAIGSGATTATANLALVVRTSANVLVDSSNPLTNLAPGTLTATVTQGGAPLANQLVNFTQTGNVANLSQTSALTDAAGRAVVPISARATGAGSATAVAVINGFNVSNTAFYSTSTGSGVSDTPVIALTVLDAANNPVSSANPIQNTSAGKLRATVTIAGVPQANAVVTFALEAGAGAVLPQSVALTNTSGVAEVAVTAAATGAGTISASATVNSVDVSTEQAYATLVVAPPTMVLGLTLTNNAPAEISPGTSVIFTATVRDTASVPQPLGSYTISFRSTCTQAVLDSPVSSASVTGIATSIYVASGSCTGTDTVTAVLTTPTQSLSASSSVTISAEPLGQVAFISISRDPAVLALKGTGGLGREESADVVFQVLGKQGSPLPNKVVCFDLSTTAGGISREPAKATSDSSGNVRATILSGTVPTPVRLIAYVDDNNNCDDAKPSTLVQGVSGQLSIATGLPDQKSFSLAVGNLNPLAYNVDGVEVRVTVFAADHFNSPVPDGTAISFWTESGAIQSSCDGGLGTVDGVCTTTWRSQNPRDSVDVRDRSVTGAAYRDRRGRSTILAYAVGEESFVDANGNGVWDNIPAEESFTDLGEVIKDTNGNGILESVLLNEEFVDFNGLGSRDTPDGAYDGVLCSQSARTSGRCSGNATVHVRDYGEIVMSTNSAKIYVISPDADTTSIDFDVNGNFTGISNPADTAYVYSPDGQTITKIFAKRNNQFSILATDSNGNTLSNGTTIKVVPDSSQGTIEGSDVIRILNVNSGLADWASARFSVKAPSITPTSVGNIEIQIKHADGTEETKRVTIDWITD